MSYVEKQHGFFVAVVASLGVMLGASAVNAETIGHWRFESSENFLEDSGPNNFDLSTVGSPAPTFLALPVSGAGSDFPNPIPQTDQPNAGVADFGTTSDGYLSTAGTDPKFDVDAFTIEAFINWNTSYLSEGQQDYVIASQCGGTDRSWQFAIGEEIDGVTQVYLYCSKSGSHDADTRYFRARSSEGFPKVFTGNDYYVAASFDLSTQTGGVNIYIKDLTAGTAMVKKTFNHDMTELYHSDLDFAIGSRATTQYMWNGLIDEVRLSDTALSQDELLGVPEPSTDIAGDANKDGKVDGSDVTILAGNWQAGVGDPNTETITWEMGDFNGDGQIDGSDVTILAGNWQAGVTAAAASVPEPSMVIMLIVAGLTLPLLRHRKK